MPKQLIVYRSKNNLYLTGILILLYNNYIKIEPKSRIYETKKSCVLGSFYFTKKGGIAWQERRTR